MAISINWLTKVISIPQSYLTAISGVQYGLDIEVFRNDLKNLEDTEEGLPYPDTHRRNAPVTLSGVNYTQTFEILSPYTVSFQNTGTPYVVVVSGANHNLADVTNFDGGMSMIVGNSAGLIINTVTLGGGVGTVAEVADAVWNAVASSFNTAGTTGNKLNSAGSSGDPWTADLSLYGAGTAGKVVHDTKTVVDTINTNTDSLETSLTTVASDLTTIKGYTDTLESSATAIAGYTDSLETSVGAIKAVTDTMPSAANIATAVRAELTTELAHIMQVPTSGALTPTQETMILEMYRLMGLDPTKPLVVTKTARTAGAGLSQQITGDANTTVVTRV